MYTEKEVRMRIEKAQLEASMEMLAIETEIAVAEAKVAVLEAAVATNEETTAVSSHSYQRHVTLLNAHKIM